MNILAGQKLKRLCDDVSLLELFQDVADFEWYVYCNYFCWQLPPLIVLHIALSRAMLKLNVEEKVRN